MDELAVTDVLVFGSIVAVILTVFGVIAWRRKFISSLKNSVKFELAKYVNRNQPREQPMDVFTVIAFSFYVPLTVVAFGGANILSSETFMFGMAMYIAVIISLLVIHHTAILQSFGARTNVYAFLHTVTGWNFLQILKVFAKPIVATKDLLERIKKKSISYSKSNKSLNTELRDFWKNDKFYTTLLHKYRNSMREACLVVTDLPWKEAIKEQPMEMDAGIKKIIIPVGALVLNYTSASEAMSSDEHKKYLGIDKVEIPAFTATTRFMSDDAHRAIAAAALDEIRSPDYRVRQECAEADNNILRERIKQIMKDKKISSRLSENYDFDKTREEKEKRKRAITPKTWALIIGSIAALIMTVLLLLYWPKV